MAPPRKPRKTAAQKREDAAKKDSPAAASESSSDSSALDAVQKYQKIDLANPESPVLPVPGFDANAPSADPEPVTIGAGDTAAAHESHVEPSSRDKIAQRIELESGEKGLPTDVIVALQQAEGRAVEAGRLDVDGDRIAAAAASDPLVASVTLTDGTVLPGGSSPSSNLAENRSSQSETRAADNAKSVAAQEAKADAKK
jgi:hypothetical protein